MGRAASTVIAPAPLGGDCHHGRKHGGDRLFFRAAHREGVAGAYADRTTRTGDARAGDEALAACRGEEIDLELDGEHGRALRHQAHGRVAAGHIEDGRDHGRGHVAVLLREVVAERQLDFDLAGCHAREPRADRVHERELGEACADVLPEIGIGWLRHGIPETKNTQKPR